MTELIRLFTQIALLRRGPADLPASQFLLALSVAGYLAVSAVLLATLPVVEGWPPRLLVSAAFMLLWYTCLLRLAGRPERILQTTTALFGVQTLQSPPLLLSEWLTRRVGDDASWQVPVALIVLILLIWAIAVNSHVVQAALEWPGSLSVAVVFLEIFAEELVQSAFFPATP